MDAKKIIDRISNNKTLQYRLLQAVLVDDNARMTSPEALSEAKEIIATFSQKMTELATAADVEGIQTLTKSFAKAQEVVSKEEATKRLITSEERTEIEQYIKDNPIRVTRTSGKSSNGQKGEDKREAITIEGETFTPVSGQRYYSIKTGTLANELIKIFGTGGDFKDTRNHIRVPNGIVAWLRAERKGDRPTSKIQ